MSTATIKPSHSKALDMAYIALTAALIALCSWITLPIGPVPFTMQTFAIFTSLGLLGGRRGTVAVVVYLLLGLVGLPVFAGFHSGPAALMGPTGGYLLGFLASALCYWAVTARLGTSTKVLLPTMILALALCYAFGTLWFLQVYTGGGQAGTLLGALGLCVFPYLLPDLAKIALALVVARRVGKHLAK
ncbi:MAG: biotin transporter BioY [Clostridiales bacterium]|nr:biotin transporter BioY [Clostridiales bacterium]MDY4173625.1 biotin transporter BioY [Evtepia sp.]